MPVHGAAPVCGHGVEPSTGQCEPWGVGCTAAEALWQRLKARLAAAGANWEHVGTARGLLLQRGGGGLASCPVLFSLFFSVCSSCERTRAIFAGLISVSTSIPSALPLGDINC